MTSGSTPLTHFSCFSGIGGIDLAAEWAGFQTLGQVELKEYPYAVLRQHWPDVLKWRDIKDVTSESIRRAGIAQPPTVLSGGFPCQPFSSAGNQRGTVDDRYLWPEMLRVVQECRPAWIVGENVDGFVRMALDESLAGLERAGYACRAFVFPAEAVGAPHERYRCFIVAHRLCSGQERARVSIRQRRPDKDPADAPGLCEDDPDNARECTYWAWKAGSRRCEHTDRAERINWYEAATRFCGVDDGVSNRVDRIEALGNAVMPQHISPIMNAIAAIEEQNYSLKGLVENRKEE